MNHISGQIYVFVERALAEGKKPDADGYYVFTQNEIVDGAGVVPSTLSCYMSDVVDMLPKDNIGWMPGSDEAIAMISDVSYSRGVLKFRRNLEAMAPELDYYWAKHPLDSYFTYTCYDDMHRRRINDASAKYGYFPHGWSEEQVEAAYNEWMNRPKEECTYSYTPSEKKSPNQQRIAAIRAKGGLHLKNFNTENKSYEMCLVAVELDGEALCYVPEEFRTKEIYGAAVKRTGSVLNRVPEKFVTKKMCEDAVASDGLALNYVPEEFKSEELCMQAVIQNQQAYAFVPSELITPKFVVNVVRKSKPESIRSIPKKLKKTPFYAEIIPMEPELLWHIPKASHTAAISKSAIAAMGFATTADAIKKNPELLSQLHTSLYDYDTCLAFVTSSFFTKTVNKRDNIALYSGFNTDSDRDKGLFYMNRRYDYLYSIPHMLKWPDICELLVSANDAFIRYVNPELLTLDLCIRAVKASKHGYIIDDIPEQLRTKELCMLAFKKDAYNIKSFPEEFITESICKKAVEQSGYCLEYVPLKFRTKNICLSAVQDGGTAKLEWIPEEVLDKEIVIAYLSNNRWAYHHLENIPERFRDYDVCLAAVATDGENIKYVPADYLTAELCLAAVKRSSRAAKYIPREVFTIEMAETITDGTSCDFEYIPKECLTEEICIKAISHGDHYGGTVLKHVPDELKTQKMCNKAIEVSVWSLAAVPERFVTYEMLLDVARFTPGRLVDNFPKRYRNKETIEKMIAEGGSESYLRKLIEE